MKTVYAIVSGSYSDYSVEFIYESKEDAEAYVEGWTERNGEIPTRRYATPRVEEMTFYPTGTGPQILYSATWWEHDDEVEYDQQVTLNDIPKSRVVSRELIYGDRGYVVVEGSDEHRVAKVLTETVAGFKLELPLLREAKKQGKM